MSSCLNNFSWLLPGILSNHLLNIFVGTLSQGDSFGQGLVVDRINFARQWLIPGQTDVGQNDLHLQAHSVRVPVDAVVGSAMHLGKKAKTNIVPVQFASTLKYFSHLPCLQKMEKLKQISGIYCMSLSALVFKQKNSKLSDTVYMTICSFTASLEVYKITGNIIF